MWGDKRVIALTLAVLHHGFSNFGKDAVPPGWQTVVNTAEKFEQHIDGTLPPGRPR